MTLSALYHWQDTEAVVPQSRDYPMKPSVSQTIVSEKYKTKAFQQQVVQHYSQINCLLHHDL